MNDLIGLYSLGSSATLFPEYTRATQLVRMNVPEIQRLQQLLYRATMYAYATSFSKPNEYTLPGAYYEQSISFLLKIQASLLKEFNILKAGGSAVNTDYTGLDQSKFNSPLIYLNSLKVDVLNCIDLLLNEKKGYCPRTSIERVASSDYLYGFGEQPIINFCYQFIRLQQQSHLDCSPYPSVVEVALPVLTRDGYAIHINFTEAVGISDLSVTDDRCESVSKWERFIATISPNDITSTDTYLYILYRMQLSRINCQKYSNVFDLLGVLFYPTDVDTTTRIRRFIIDSGYVVKQSHYGSLARLISTISNITKYNKPKTGVKTIMLLQAAMDANVIPVDRVKIAELIGNANEGIKEIIATEALIDADDIEVEPIEPTPLQPKEDDPQEDPTDDDIESDPDETDPSEDDSDTNVPEDEIPVALVRVPKGSYLLSIQNPELTSLDEYLYRMEVSNLITRVLRNPPPKIKQSQLDILAKIQHEWLYLLDVKSIDTFVNNILKIVSK